MRPATLPRLGSSCYLLGPAIRLQPGRMHSLRGYDSLRNCILGPRSHRESARLAGFERQACTGTGEVVEDCQRWSQNVLCQFFSDQDDYEHRLPCDATQIGRYRRALDEEGLEQLLKATIDAAVAAAPHARRSSALARAKPARPRGSASGVPWWSRTSTT